MAMSCSPRAYMTGQGGPKTLPAPLRQGFKKGWVPRWNTGAAGPTAERPDAWCQSNGDAIRNTGKTRGTRESGRAS